MGKFRIAVATKGSEGLADVVSEVFGRANTFTIVNVDEEEIEEVLSLENDIDMPIDDEDSDDSDID